MTLAPVMGERHFPPLHAPCIPESKAQAGFSPHRAPKVSGLEFHEPAFQAWGLHRQRSALSQASKFPSRTSCPSSGPSQLASGVLRQLLPGRGGVGEAESARTTLSCPVREAGQVMTTVHQEQTRAFPLIVLSKSQNRTFDWIKLTRTWRH